MPDVFDIPSYDQGGRVAAALERIANVQEGKTSSLSTLERQIAASFEIAKTGKVYRTRFYKFSTNSTSSGTKLDDNAGLVCTPSTDTVEGQDNYADIPMFKWMRCNYTRDDEDGFARPTVLENMPGFATAGAVDVGTLFMTFYWTVEVKSTYYDVIVSDSPHTELGLVPWCEAVKSDGTVMPYFIYSSYPSGTASDGNLRSQPGLYPAYGASHDNIIAAYQKKGKGYWGAGASRSTYIYIMLAIKYATKNIQKISAGCTSFNYTTQLAVAETGVKRVLIASNPGYYAGCCISVGTANSDWHDSTTYDICDRVKVKSIETVTVNGTSYTALNLDIDSTINTATTYYVKAFPCFAGETDSVIAHHDGAYLSNTDGRHTFRIQGLEILWGQWAVFSDIVLSVNSDLTRDVYVAPRGVAHVAGATTNMVKIGMIPLTTEGWIGDFSFDIAHGVFWPESLGSGDSVGVGDYYLRDTATSGLREFLCHASLVVGSRAGFNVTLHSALGASWWDLASCD